MTVLVTGGAGYIGAHVVRLLQDRSESVVVFDDLATGDRSRIHGTEVVVGDLATDAGVRSLVERLSENDISEVIHFAARKRVSESVERPAWYYQQNVGGMANLLMACEQFGIGRMIFSSSAAVYGSGSGGSIREDESTVPINAYGATKLVGEHLLADAARAFDLRSVALRYFNVAGAGSPDLGDTAVLNLIPMVFERIDAGEPPVIFGDDYDTPDGTCVRDFIHVLDLAGAHIAALDALRDDRVRVATFNVGTGVGTSVREMIDAIAEVTTVLPPTVLPRRVGDPAAIVASAELIRERLGWAAERDVLEMVQSAWCSHVHLSSTATA